MMFQLARELRAIYRRILVTTTTHIHVPEKDQCDRCLLFDQLHKSTNGLCGITAVGYQELQPENKYTGLEFYQLAKLKNRFDCILIESDGAAGKSIKTPSKHEPVIWPETSILIGVTGFSAFEKPIDFDIVHRPGCFAAFANKQVGEKTDHSVIAHLIDSPKGLFKNTPDGCKTVWVINQVDSSEQRVKAEGFVKYVLNFTRRPDRVIIRGNQNPLKVLG